MAIYEIQTNDLRKLDETSFSEAGFKERSVQRLLRERIKVVADDILVIAEEFGEWEGSRRRIDLLAIDKKANLVVIELKRTEDGGHMELQAIRYAAMVSTMTFDRAVETFSGYLAHTDNKADAAQLILDFLDWSEPDEDSFAQDVRIILVSADFSKELTTSVMWLNERGLDVRCVRLKPYNDNGRTLIDVQQVIPLPEAQDYMVGIREKVVKERIDRSGKSGRHQLRKDFWIGLLERISGKIQLFDNVSASKDNWINAGSGMSGMHFTFVIRKLDAQVLFVMEAEKNRNKLAFDWLNSRRDDIEKVFGHTLTWRRADDRKHSSIFVVLDHGGIHSEKTDWPGIQDGMIETMVRLEKAISPLIPELRQHLQSI